MSQPDPAKIIRFVKTRSLISYSVSFHLNSVGEFSCAYCRPRSTHSESSGINTFGLVVRSVMVL